MLFCLTAFTVSAQQLSSRDKEILENATKRGMKVVHIGNMGLRRGSIPAVKKYSQRLVDDHKKAKQKGPSLHSDSTRNGSGSQSPHGSANRETNAVADGGPQGSTGPGRQASSPESQSKCASERSRSPHHSGMSAHGPDIIAGKPGSDFDQKIVRLAVAGHQNEFEKAAGSASDNDVKAWANQTLSALRAKAVREVRARDGAPAVSFAVIRVGPVRRPLIQTLTA